MKEWVEGEGELVGIQIVVRDLKIEKDKDKDKEEEWLILVLHLLRFKLLWHRDRIRVH